MSSVLFDNAQRVIKQMYDFLQTSSQNKTANFITDSFQTGIVPLELGEFLVVPGSNNTSLTPTVTVGSGVAYELDSSRIIVPSGDITPYNSSNPSNTTNDGLGNLLSTPQSTGVVNIPLTQSSQNYLWIQYLATIDTSAYTLNKETQAKQFYKQTDGYQITVTTTNVAPGPNYLYLANVNMLGGGAVTSSVIFITNRTYFQINEGVVPITTAFNDRSNATTVYTENSVYNLEAHIKAIGTGTGQSPTNPHNMSLQDLGVSAFDTVQAHRQLEHGANADTASANAIIAGTTSTPYPSSSAMATSINIVNPGSDTINVFQLTSSEVAIVNGSAFNVNAIFGAIPVNATIAFPDTSGTYNVYWDSVAKVFAVTTSSIDSDVTKLWLCTVTYTFVGHGISDHNMLSSLIEKRRIGSTTEKYQRWVTTARPSIPIVGEYGFNNTFSQFEYWDGSSWISFLPLSGGTMSGVINMGSNKITNLANGTTSTDAAAFGQIPVLRSPTVQRFTSGSGTYTTPSSPSPLYLKVRVVGAGGGGSGSGSGGTATPGAAGGTSSFFNMVCNGGNGGVYSAGSPASGAAGGSASAGGGVTYNVIQNGGAGGTGYNSGSIVWGPGGNGGGTPFSGGAQGNQNVAGTNGEVNTGEGGSGAGMGGGVTVPGAGGGGGAYLEGFISSPTTSYSYAVGVGGSGGASEDGGFTGGVGGSGLVIVEEYYQ